MARRATALGTLAAPGWSRDWLARVDKDELALGRRICGAMSPNMTPCTLVSDHRFWLYGGGWVTGGWWCILVSA